MLPDLAQPRYRVLEGTPCPLLDLPYAPVSSSAQAQLHRKTKRSIERDPATIAATLAEYAKALRSLQQGWSLQFLLSDLNGGQAELLANAEQARYQSRQNLEQILDALSPLLQVEGKADLAQQVGRMVFIRTQNLLLLQQEQAEAWREDERQHLEELLNFFLGAQRMFETLWSNSEETALSPRISLSLSEALLLADLNPADMRAEQQRPYLSIVHPFWRGEKEGIETQITQLEQIRQTLSQQLGFTQPQELSRARLEVYGYDNKQIQQAWQEVERFLVPLGTELRRSAKRQLSQRAEALFQPSSYLSKPMDMPSAARCTPLHFLDALIERLPKSLQQNWRQLSTAGYLKEILDQEPDLAKVYDLPEQGLAALLVYPVHSLDDLMQQMDAMGECLSLVGLPAEETVLFSRQRLIDLRWTIQISFRLLFLLSLAAPLAAEKDELARQRQAGWSEIFKANIQALLHEILLEVAIDKMQTARLERDKSGYESEALWDLLCARFLPNGLAEKEEERFLLAWPDWQTLYRSTLLPASSWPRVAALMTALYMALQACQSQQALESTWQQWMLLAAMGQKERYFLTLQQLGLPDPFSKTMLRRLAYRLARELDL